jgi:hypothetical protein
VRAGQVLIAKNKQNFKRSVVLFIGIATTSIVTVLLISFLSHQAYAIDSSESNMPTVSVHNITETTASLSVYTGPVREDYYGTRGFTISISDSQGNSVYTGLPSVVYFFNGETNFEYNITGPLKKGAEYKYEVQSYDNPTQIQGVFKTLGIFKPQINQVTFETVYNKRLLNVEGVDFDNNIYLDSRIFSTSRFKLNNEIVPLCSFAAGAGPTITKQYILDVLGSAANPDVISDTPICYAIVLYDENNSSPQIMFNNTRVSFIIPEDFNETLEGTVQFSDTEPFTYNEGVTLQQPDDPASEVQISESANNDLSDGGRIESLPTFSGKAPAGSAVTVTVRSDPVTCSTTADADGNWQCTLSSRLPNGTHSVTVAVTTVDGRVLELGPYEVSVLELSGILPPNTGIKPVSPIAWALL